METPGRQLVDSIHEHTYTRRMMGGISGSDDRGTDKLWDWGGMSFQSCGAVLDSCNGQLENSRWWDDQVNRVDGIAGNIVQSGSLVEEIWSGFTLDFSQWDDLEMVVIWWCWTF